MLSMVTQPPRKSKTEGLKHREFLLLNFISIIVYLIYNFFKQLSNKIKFFNKKRRNKIKSLEIQNSIFSIKTIYIYIYATVLNYTYSLKKIKIIMNTSRKIISGFKVLVFTATTAHINFNTFNFIFQFSFSLKRIEKSYQI